jgi:RNA polymerase sigma-70 factor (ECF subfamily)
MHEWADTAGRLVVIADPAIRREFETTLAASARLAFRVAYSVLRQREDAEDVAQDVLAKAHRSLAQLRDPARLRAWLVRMTWRMALDRREDDRRRAVREHVAPLPAGPPAPDPGVVSADRAVGLGSAIDSLPEKLRIVIVLNAIEEHDLAEVAAMLGIPEGTVKSRLFEARKHLRERLT